MFEAPALGRILFDCGMHQGGNRVDRKQKKMFLFDRHKIDAVILYHAQFDHNGLLPKLVHEGYNSSIHCSGAIDDLLHVMLLDSVGIYLGNLHRENCYLTCKG